jgi:hypothetical protein
MGAPLERHGDVEIGVAELAATVLGGPGPATVDAPTSLGGIRPSFFMSTCSSSPGRGFDGPGTAVGRSS